MTSVLRRERRVEDTEMGKGTGRQRWTSELCSHKPSNSWSHQQPGEAGRILSSVFGGNVACQYLFGGWREVTFYFYLFKKCFVEFIGVTLVNKIIYASGAQFYNASSVYCIVVHHPKSSLHPSPFTPLYPPLPPSTPRLPSGNHRHLDVGLLAFGNVRE